jgi:hypothetical protein
MPLAVSSSRELLALLLGGHQLSATDLDDVVHRLRSEDLYLDFKSGKQDTTKASTVLREYVTGFANSDGGVLVMGIAEPAQKGQTYEIDGCPQRGNATLDEWATHSLRDVAAYFAPMPRFQTVKHPKGDVLVCAVARAPALIPLIVAGSQQYYVRMGDSTLAAPGWLLSDLVLGRRNHPLLEATVLSVTAEYEQMIYPGTSFAADTIALGFSFGFDNVSLVPARDVQVGIVGWTLNPTANSPTPTLRSHVDAVVPDLPGLAVPGDYWRLHHMRYSGRELGAGAFGSFTAREIVRLHVAQYHGRLAQFEAALYAVASGSPPEWFQLRVIYDGLWPNTAEVARKSAVSMEKTFGRPRLSWSLR